ncbi:MAG: DUF853 family protein [Eggerthellaceae bacterium]|nr:DUF853 family protein [Eggerthellaceae bacterium]
MFIDGKLLIAKGTEPVYLLPGLANRHGLITGATGTGKTVTMKTIAQSMSDAGIPVFLADVKGDVSGVAVAGEATEKLVDRLAALGVYDYDFHGCPTRFWDVYGEGGVPCRTTILEMGPVLLSRLLGLSEVQEGVMNIVFHVADDEGLLLLDLKDLRTMVNYVGEHAKDYTLSYGQISTQSIGAIQRALLQLEDAGGNIFFGEPALDIIDWLATDADGKGYINVLHCVRLVQSPLMYSTFLLWMLSELYEMLPEVGDLDKPKVCFFFDEAHMLFNEAPRALLDKVEQIVKLVRSKGVGVYFVTQNPSDIPNPVLAQLSNKVQHALRAYTPAEQKAIKAAAESFRINPDFDTAEAITELGTGEALISFLQEDGTPMVVQRCKVIAPTCSMDAAPDDAKDYIISNDALRSRYGRTYDRDSAYEILNASFLAAQRAAEAARIAEEDARLQAELDAAAEKQRLAEEKEAERRRIAEEKEAERQRIAEEKAAERQRIAEEKEAERQRIAAEKEAERQVRLAQQQAEREAREAAKKAEAEEKARLKQEEADRKAKTKLIDAALTSAARAAGSGVGRGLLGTLKKLL